MRKYLSIIACLSVSALTAELIGDVEFQFPPSIQEWTLVANENSFCPLENSQLKVYTHEEGNSLEFFVAVHALDNKTLDLEEEDREPLLQIKELVQVFIDEQLKAYLPDHKISLTQLDEENGKISIAWELSNTLRPVLYGLGLAFEEKGHLVVLQYMTTAIKTPENVKSWKQVLDQAKIVDLSTKP